MENLTNEQSVVETIELDVVTLETIETTSPRPNSVFLKKKGRH